jgi:predicted phosphate transport protein (TIGR00153 family)
MPLQRLLNWILPREDHFFLFLERQAEVVHRAAKTFAMFREGMAATEIRSSIETLEAEADTISDELLAALSATFVTPIDREDLQRLSKKLDDIVDYIDMAARACVLYGVAKPTVPMLALVDRLVASTAALHEALPHLRGKRYEDIFAIARKVEALEKEGDTVFRDALSALFHDPEVDAKTILREKEVLEDLEQAIDRCEQVAETLVNVAVKHA